MGIAEVDGELVELPEGVVSGGKRFADGTQHFKLLGGRYHDHTVRVGPPYVRVIFGPPEKQDVYKLTPPVTKTGQWVYVHDQDDHEPYTAAERGAGTIWGPTRSASVVEGDWQMHAAFKAEDDEAIQKLIVAREEHQ